MLSTVISRLELTDFKAFHSLDLALRPLTVLLGENSSGKSSIIAALSLLSQTETGFDPRVPLLLQGELTYLGTYRDVVFGNHRGRPFRIELGFFDTEAMREMYSLSLEFKYRTVRRELVLRQVALARVAPLARHLITVTYSFDASRHLITRLAGRNVPPSSRARLSDYLRMYHFLPMLTAAVRRSGRGRSTEFLDGFLPRIGPGH